MTSLCQRSPPTSAKLFPVAQPAFAEARAADLERAKEADLERVADHFATVKGKIMNNKARRDPPSICPLCRRLVPRRSFRALPPSRAS